MVDRVAELVVMILRNVIGGGTAPPAEPVAFPLDNVAGAPNVATPLSERAHVVENNSKYADVPADSMDLTPASVWGGAR